MDVWEIEQIVRKGGATLAESLYNYWPAKTFDVNDVSERNLTQHVGAAFINEGFSVFAEANFSENRRLDTLALNYTHKLQVRVEAKRLYSSEKADGVATDIDRIRIFKLQDSDNEFSIKCYTNKVGIILAQSGYWDIVKWWDNPSEDAPGERQGKGWGEIIKLLRNGDNCRGFYPLVPYFPDDNESSMRCYCMLYVIFPL